MGSTGSLALSSHGRKNKWQFLPIFFGSQRPIFQSSSQKDRIYLRVLNVHGSVMSGRLEDCLWLKPVREDRKKRGETHPPLWVIFLYFDSPPQSTCFCLLLIIVRGILSKFKSLKIIYLILFLGNYWRFTQIQ